MKPKPMLSVRNNNDRKQEQNKRKKINNNNKLKLENNVNGRSTEKLLNQQSLG